MEWNRNLNPGGLGMELESWTQSFGEQWNEIRIQSLLFGEQSWNGIKTVFDFEIYECNNELLI